MYWGLSVRKDVSTFCQESLKGKTGLAVKRNIVARFIMLEKKTSCVRFIPQAGDHNTVLLNICIHLDVLQSILMLFGLKAADSNNGFDKVAIIQMKRAGHTDFFLFVFFDVLNSLLQWVIDLLYKVNTSRQANGTTFTACV